MIYYICAVKVVEVSDPRPHRHIGRVRLTNGEVLSRAKVISRIDAGDTFYTVGNPQGRVYVVECPHCEEGDYITTARDFTSTNNLLALPGLY
jgi:Protein of unknown function (DUF3892)